MTIESLNDVVANYASDGTYNTGKAELLALYGGQAGIIPASGDETLSFNEALAVLAAGGAPEPAAETTTGLWLPGASGNYVSTPDHADFDFTDLSVVMHLAPTTWDTNQAFWQHHTGADPGVYLRGWTSGPYGNYENKQIFATNNTPLTDGEAGWLAVNMRPNNGGFIYMDFYAGTTRENMARFAQKIATSPATIPTTSVGDFRVGVNDTGSLALQAKLYRVEVYSGVGDASAPGLGTLVAEADFSFPWVSGRYTDQTGKVWTANGSAWAWEYA